MGTAAAADPPPGPSPRAALAGAAALSGLRELRGPALGGLRAAGEALRGFKIRPHGPGVSDQNAAERALNLLTTPVYALLALRHAAAARTPERRLYAASLGAVTAACTAFHATSGGAKEWARKADVWAIAGAATALTRLVHPRADASNLTHVALALTPVQPFAVIAAHALTAEVDFARAAKHDPALRGPWRSHVAATALGLAAWAAEDADPALPFCHSAWHVLSAVGMGCTEPFVEKMEDRLLASRAKRR